MVGICAEGRLATHGGWCSRSGSDDVGGQDADAADLDLDGVARAHEHGRIHPGADPNQIRITYPSASSISLNPEGILNPGGNNWFNQAQARIQALETVSMSLPSAANRAPAK